MYVESFFMVITIVFIIDKHLPASRLGHVMQTFIHLWPFNYMQDS